jgi:serine/threonine-protein kinase
MGTPLYMSPEQCKGAGLLDHRTDIYSLGVMIFEMVAGRPPFMAEGIGELFAKHMLEEAPSLLELAPQTPPAMAAAVMRSLNKELDDRFSSMEDFRKALLGEVAISGAVAKPAAKRSGSIGAATRSLAPTQTMSPQAQSTTLSSASSEIDDELAPSKRKMGVIVGVVGGLAAAGVVAFLVTSKSGSTSDAPKASAMVAPAAPVAPPAPPAKTTVTVRFEALPAGAHVVRKSDGHDLGASPIDVKLPHNGPGTDYVVKKDGYKDFAVTADLSEDNTVHVALEKIEAPPAPTAAKVEPEKKKPSSGGHKPARRHGGAVPDEDGLATPSF